MNMWLEQSQMKLHRQYMNSLHLIMIENYKIELLLMNFAHLQKFRVFYDFIVNALCDELSMNHA